MNKQEQNLIQAVLAGVSTEKPPICDDWTELYSLAKYHGIQSILAELLDKVSEIPQNIVAKLKEEQTLLLIKEANQEAEINKLMELFESQSTPVVMLKGWYIKKLYPRPDIRSMADTDMYIKQSDEKKIHNILKEQEYSVVTFGEKKDNVYRKEPFIILEMHKNLFMFEDDWNNAFSDKASPMYIWNRVVKIENHDHIYRMDDELFFTYMIAHIAKHLKDDGGIGIKAFLDIWLFMKSKPELEFKIIKRDLEQIGLSVFSGKVINLTEYWFEKKSTDKTTEEFGSYIFNCGVYGNSKNLVATKDNILVGDNPSKLKYLFKRAFPPIESMLVRYPQLNSNKWLLPFLYMKRLSYSIIHRRADVKSEIKNSSNINYDEVNKIHRLYKDIGLIKE